MSVFFNVAADGRLEILDRGGGALSCETIRLSRWQLLDGWLVTTASGKARDGGKKDDDGAPPTESTEPPKPKTGI